MTHKYNVGDIVKVKYINKQERVAIILDKAVMKGRNSETNTYQIMMCGITEGPTWFFESLIMEKL